MLEFQKTEIYRVALDLNALVGDLSEEGLSPAKADALRALQKNAQMLIIDLIRLQGDYPEGVLDEVYACAAMVDVYRLGPSDAAVCDRVQELLDQIVALSEEPKKKKARGSR
jgi:hypothetical protein